MPEMNGGDVINKLRESRPDLPVLLVTGSADSEAIQGRLPGVAMLLKPFDHEVLTQRVASMLGATGSVQNVQ
jgi:CheY-like chemotaxis protein